jgi:hypothetical protein
MRDVEFGLRFSVRRDQTSKNQYSPAVYVAASNNVLSTNLASRSVPQSHVIQDQIGRLIRKSPVVQVVVGTQFAATRALFFLATWVRTVDKVAVRNFTWKDRSIEKKNLMASARQQHGGRRSRASRSNYDCVIRR